jgi:hypothetical protein
VIELNTFVALGATIVSIFCNVARSLDVVFRQSIILDIKSASAEMIQLMYRAKKDGPVLLGWKHPWDH